MVTGLEDAQFRFMQSVLTEMKVMNDHLLDIKKEFKRFNDHEDAKEELKDLKQSL